MEWSNLTPGAERVSSPDSWFTSRWFGGSDVWSSTTGTGSPNSQEGDEPFAYSAETFDFAHLAEDRRSTPEQREQTDDDAPGSAADDSCDNWALEGAVKSYSLPADQCHLSAKVKRKQAAVVNTVDLHALTASGRFLREASSANLAPSQSMLPAGVQLESVHSGTFQERMPKESSGKTNSTAEEIRPDQVVASPEPKCPICERAVTCRKQPRQKLSSTTAACRFAHYAPRAKGRKDNRMAAWYSKFGYTGPSYCKACAESFASHLLKRAARSQGVVCTRTDPCVRCTMILGHFDVPKDTVFSKSDESKRCSRRPNHKQAQPSKKRNQTGKQKQAQVKRLTSRQSGPEKTSPLLDASFHAGQSQRRRKVAIVTAVAFAVALVSTRWLGSSQSSTSAQGAASQETKWICGAGSERILANASLSPSTTASICKNLPASWTFPCPINDCAKGQVPIGERTCRCDGCFATGGRCAGWVLEGYGPYYGDGCEKAIEPDPQPYIWPVPGELDEMGCDMLQSSTRGCLGSSSEEGQCNLSFSRPWPQPMVQAWGSATAWGGMRSGTTWSLDDRQVWAYTLDDCGLLNFAGVGQQIDPNTTSSLDAHLMWKYDAKTQRWRSISSSLTERPGPRSGAGQWVDNTGSLFLLGGLPTKHLGMERIVPFSVEDVDYDVKRTDTDFRDVVELWRYDTQTLTWHALHGQMKHQDSTYNTAPAFLWPSARAGAAVWRDHGTGKSGGSVSSSSSSSSSSDSDSDSSSVTVWMFGGWAHIPFGSRGSVTGPLGQMSAELWQYFYKFTSHGGQHSHDSASGRWKLVAAASQTGSADFPSARMDAGSWSGTNGAAGGWIFGGVTNSTGTARSFGSLFAEPGMVNVRALNDLWHWNGDLQRPTWSQIVQPHQTLSASASTPSAWPPRWQAPLGWTSDANGGELWLFGGSGEVEDTNMQAYGLVERGTNLMWRFSLATQAWYRHQISDVEGAGVWPSARESAGVTSSGVMLGGIARGYAPTECLSNGVFTDGGPLPDGAPLLSSMWRWQDDLDDSVK